MEAINPQAKPSDDGMPFVIVMHWLEVQRKMRGEWYKCDAETTRYGYTVYADYLHCKRDAERGNKRAKRFMSALAEFRLTGKISDED